MIATLLADLILVIHFLVMAFIMLGQAGIIIGYFAKWPWVRNRLFRISHLAAIAVVVLQAWAGRWCPLTIWENQLRAAAGRELYTEIFIQHWLSKLIYYDFPLWVFALIYTLFGAIVLASWFVVKPGKLP